MTQTNESCGAINHYMMALEDNVGKVMSFESKLERYLSGRTIDRTVLDINQNNQFSIFNSRIELITLNNGSSMIYRRHTFDRHNSGYGDPTRNVSLYVSATERQIRAMKKEFEVYLDRSIYTEQMNGSPFTELAKKIE